MHKKGAIECVLTDYGISQYARHQRPGRIPVFWSAPEVLSTSTPSFEGDVWSIGKYDSFIFIKAFLKGEHFRVQ